MSLTPQDRAWLDLRGDLTDKERAVCDNIMMDAAFSAKSHAVPMALFGDELAAFEAACVRLLITSRGKQ